MPFLLVREPGRLSISVPIHHGLTVGRHADSDLLLAYPEVSRHHAHFDHDAGQWSIWDDGSHTGTFLNGVRTHGTQLKNGDNIRIGPAQLAYFDRDPREITYSQESPTADIGAVSHGDPRLRLLFEMSRAAFADADPDETLERMLDAILRVMDADRAVAALCEGSERDPLRYLIRKRPRFEPTGDPALSRAIIDALLKRESVIIRNSQEGSPSAMGAPLQVGGRLLGFVYLEDQQRRDRFNTEDLDYLNALACLTAAALDNAERYHRAATLAEAASATTGALDEIIGKGPAIQRLKEKTLKYAASGGTNVLVHGESGTGKELVARALHAASPRAARPFLAVNCAAIPESMIEGELFGYEQGAFTGALRARRGRFALAHRGTLFLDEIGDLSLTAQAKVLRAAQDGEILPLGAEQPIRVDVRIVAATHKDLRKEITEKRFREDLFFRLGTVEIEVPPLRERGPDTLMLAQIFLEAMALNLGKRIGGFSSAARAAIEAYAWPGNVRELKNEMERAAIHAEGSFVELDDLGPALVKTVEPLRVAEPLKASASLSERYAALDSLERALVEEALAVSRGNLAEAARHLGITRIMIKRRVERFGLRWRDT